MAAPKRLAIALGSQCFKIAKIREMLSLNRVIIDFQLKSKICVIKHAPHSDLHEYHRERFQNSSSPDATS